MAAYLLKRLLLIIPTMLGIMLISFAIIQVAPGGPVERMIAQLTGTDVGATARIGGQTGDSGRSLQQGGQPGADSLSSKYRGAQGLAAKPCGIAGYKCLPRSRGLAGIRRNVRVGAQPLDPPGIDPQYRSKDLRDDGVGALADIHGSLVQDHGAVRTNPCANGRRVGQRCVSAPVPTGSDADAAP